MQALQNIQHFLKGVKMDNQTAALLTGVACAVGSVVVLVKKISSHRKAEEKIMRAKSRREESLQRAEQAVLRYKESHPTTDSFFILALSLSELTKQLKEGSLTPEDVFYSYMEKTLALNKKLNCCTEVLLESLDQLKTVGSNKDGLLYGVPVSIKENVAFKDHDCSCGVIINLDQPVEKDSVLVQVLKKQGAIPFVKTNLPQALLSYDCSNPIYGQTVNPHNPQKTSGGSSGGEGALIGGGGSLLGIGTDIGGSIRIPASFCGICGFKPTAGRLSLQGVRPIYRGQKTVSSSAGPMARDVDSLALCMQALLCDHMFSLDPTVPPLPFNMEIYRSSRPLRIGYLENDGYTQPSPSMARGVREVKALLEQAGHTFVPYCPLKMNEIVPELWLRGLLADGTTSLLQKLKGGPVDPCLKPQVFEYRLPKWLKKIISFLLKPVSPRTSARISALCGVGSVPELWKQHAAVEDYIHETIAHWRSCKIDVLLCPVIGPAFNFLYCGKTSVNTNYTFLYNLLNFPAGVVTVSTVTAEDEEEFEHYPNKFNKVFKEAVAGGEGLPVAVQCVALPWQDELCLHFMKEVEQLVKQSKK
ncbi:vitamin D3 hydroxylase-associated protein [Oreochromis niloticus]|uniref:Fatty-acid amide hydrolase 1 n=2 Tax=Oreochromis TaxID=8139 RepID=A0A669DBW8_ORENI|nr:vitamin D3 hydroxylase-associated protein [Oreochromis niloticus]XP_039462886.1 vitamin D3 hydroxylase-associated protein-like [Oreochromis aureus]